MKHTQKAPAKPLEGLNNAHWVFEEYRQRVHRKDAQQILIDNPTIIFRGRLRWIACKHVGAGIYEIYKGKEVTT